MISFLLINKLKYYLNSHRNPWKIILTVVLVFTAWFYGRLLGELSNQLASGEIDFVSVEKFSTLTLLAILAFVLIRMVFPSYRPLQQIFPKYLPLSAAQRYFALIINDFISPYFFYLFLFILSYAFYALHEGFDFILSGILILTGSVLLRRCIQSLIDFRLSITGKLSPLLLIPMVYINYGILELNPLSQISLFTLACLLFFIAFIQEINIAEKRNKEITGKTQISNAFFKMILNNRKARLPLMIGILFKAFILYSDFFLFKTKGEHLFDGLFIYWLFASPMLLFTYVFNNQWAFWKNFWLTYELRTGEYRTMIKQYFKLMLIPILVDAVFSIPILIVTWDMPVLILLFYFSAAAYLIMFSFLWSLITPRKIGSTFQMKNSVSMVSTLSAASGVSLLTLIKVNQWFYVMIPVMIIIGGVALWIGISMYKDKKYLIVNKVMKN